MKVNSHQPRSLAVITGATGGVGLEIAKGLARAGYDIIVGAHSERRGTDAVTEIRSVATDPASIQQSPLDLASLASVAAFAAHIVEFIKGSTPSILALSWRLPPMTLWLATITANSGANRQSMGNRGCQYGAGASRPRNC